MGLQDFSVMRVTAGCMVGAVVAADWPKATVDIPTLKQAKPQGERDIWRLHAAA
jgi:hypothetical protein